MRLFRATHADDVWREAWNAIRDEGSQRPNATKGGSRELLHCAFGLDDARQRWVYSRTPALNPAFAIAEIVWILAGRRDAKFLTAWNPSLATFTGGDAELHGAYGYRLRSHLGFDQLQQAFAVLSADQDQRQVVLQVWDSVADFPDSDGLPRSHDVPCNVCALVKVSGGRLEWLQIMRSNDLVLGLPYNIFQWTTIQEVLAGWLDLEVGSYNHVSDSLHVYDRDIERFSPSLTSNLPRNDDDLRLPLSRSLAVWEDMAQSIELISRASGTADVFSVLAETDLPRAYKNLLLVMASERCRRLSHMNEARTWLAAIENEAVAASLAAWFGRVGVAI